MNNSHANPSDGCGQAIGQLKDKLYSNFKRWNYLKDI